METQLDPVIAATIAQRRAEIQKLAAVEEAQQAARELNARAAHRAAWDALEFVLQTWQPSLYAYWQRPADDEEPVRGIAQRVIFQAPELAPFCAYFSYADNGVWSQTGSRDGKYTVMRYSLEYRNEYSTWCSSFSALADALVDAQDEYRNLLALQAGLDRERAERDAAQQERALIDEVASEISDAHARQQDSEREALLEALENDPLAVSLVTLFLDVQQERAGYRETIDNLTDQLAQTDEHYSERLAAARREATSNADRAAEAETEATNANARFDADTAARKLKQAQRGW